MANVLTEIKRIDSRKTEAETSRAAVGQRIPRFVKRGLERINGGSQSNAARRSYARAMEWKAKNVNKFS